MRYNLRAMEIGQGNLKFFNLEVTEYIHRTELSYHLSVSIQEKKNDLMVFDVKTLE